MMLTMLGCIVHHRLPFADPAGADAGGITHHSHLNMLRHGTSPHYYRNHETDKYKFGIWTTTCENVHYNSRLNAHERGRE